MGRLAGECYFRTTRRQTLVLDVCGANGGACLRWAGVFRQLALLGVYISVAAVTAAMGSALTADLIGEAYAYTCGSWLACDSGVSVDESVGRPAVIAGKPAPTGECSSALWRCCCSAFDLAFDLGRPVKPRWPSQVSPLPHF